ncbi:type I phosphodiesterase/nucleotide pyrophosphatase [Haladaptatus paucihalophilus DX253]|uniref:Predicted phosphohydrolase or phosphomutase, AlkP superfamily n=1 Tax=Haladaptatus paucihalophilus DX253 TaxID=797209 RepID=E7QSB7_HALPU|nr:alkaline phosphatase family protein [Haladaptatus paucihalophilus]EFW92886.1 type I phosphodiesterase/nucleotide pyrophosphatase [Haladaptatus paucihalophilus DX253]SHK09846.1 Predicted phosphohydrolase or phosphomutase, AlkP superfamily [Haladaptatus paucihalophilus DX253]
MSGNDSSGDGSDGDIGNNEGVDGDVGNNDGLRTLVLGLDGACPPILEPLFSAGALPNLRSIFDGGVSGPLESQLPPWTPSAWPSLFTGVNPGKHGVFSFLDYEGYDWSVVDGSDVRAVPVWEHLSRHGFSSVVVNVPVTHPPREFDGALVPGYMAPDSPACHPPDLLSDIREEIEDYRVYPETTDLSPEEAAAEYRDVVEMRGEAFRLLADRFDPDFGFLQFQQTDTVFHEFPGERETVRAVYEAVDEQVGEVLDATDPDTVLVVSDHGMGEMTGTGFYVNEFLAKHGYVDVSQGGDGMPSWVPTRESRLRNGDADGDDADDPNLLRRVTALAAKCGLTTTRAGKLLSAVGLRDFASEHVPAGVVRASGRQVDFPASTAYMRARIECGVRINLAGRDPNGVVPPERYEALRTELISLLEGVETPDGEPLFEDVARREAYFDGPEADRAVDIVTVPSDFDHFLSAELSGDEFAAPGQPWNHKRNGVVAMAGDGIDGPLGDAHIFDVTPTVLALFGVPTSTEMDGEALSSVEPVGERSYPTRREGGRERKEEAREDGREPTASEESMENRLTALGYLE